MLNDNSEQFLEKYLKLMKCIKSDKIFLFEDYVEFGYRNGSRFCLYFPNIKAYKNKL